MPVFVVTRDQMNGSGPSSNNRRSKGKGRQSRDYNNNNGNNNNNSHSHSSQRTSLASLYPPSSSRPLSAGGIQRLQTALQEKYLIHPRQENFPILTVTPEEIIRFLLSRIAMATDERETIVEVHGGVASSVIDASEEERMMAEGGGVERERERERDWEKYGFVERQPTDFDARFVLTHEGIPFEYCRNMLEEFLFLKLSTAIGELYNGPALRFVYFTKHALINDALSVMSIGNPETGKNIDVEFCYLRNKPRVYFDDANSCIIPISLLTLGSARYNGATLCGDFERMVSLRRSRLLQVPRWMEISNGLPLYIHATLDKGFSAPQREDGLLCSHFCSSFIMECKQSAQSGREATALLQSFMRSHYPSSPTACLAMVVSIVVSLLVHCGEAELTVLRPSLTALMCRYLTGVTDVLEDGSDEDACAEIVSTILVCHYLARPAMGGVDGFDGWKGRVHAVFGSSSSYNSSASSSSSSAYTSSASATPPAAPSTFSSSSSTSAPFSLSSSSPSYAAAFPPPPSSVGLSSSSASNNNNNNNNNNDNNNNQDNSRTENNNNNNNKNSKRRTSSTVDSSTSSASTSRHSSYSAAVARAASTPTSTSYAAAVNSRSARNECSHCGKSSRKKNEGCPHHNTASASKNGESTSTTTTATTPSSTKPSSSSTTTSSSSSNDLQDKIESAKSRLFPLPPTSRRRTLYLQKRTAPPQSSEMAALMVSDVAQASARWSGAVKSVPTKLRCLLVAVAAVLACDRTDPRQVTSFALLELTRALVNEDLAADAFAWVFEGSLGQYMTKEDRSEAMSLLDSAFHSNSRDGKRRRKPHSSSSSSVSSSSFNASSSSSSSANFSSSSSSSLHARGATLPPPPDCALPRRIAQRRRVAAWYEGGGGAAAAAGAGAGTGTSTFLMGRPAGITSFLFGAMALRSTRRHSNGLVY